jgi:hypothetical protein
VAAVVLLRSVGYVLATIDCKINSKYKVAIDDAWRELNIGKPSPAIFWSFIDAERHNIVHQYEVGAGQGATVHLGQNKPVEHHYLINTGPFTGQDQRGVLPQAILWWEGYLDAIDKEATRCTLTSPSSGRPPAGCACLRPPLMSNYKGVPICQAMTGNDIGDRAAPSLIGMQRVADWRNYNRSSMQS